MAHQQRLKLTLRNVVNDRTWTGTNYTREVTADPEDHDTLRGYLEQMARSLDGRTGEPWWRVQYEVRVEGLDQTWRDFTVPGGAL
jgi:hypothetical protein